MFVVNITAGDKVLLEFSTFEDRFLSVVTDVRDDGRLLAYAPITDSIVERLRTDDFVFVRFAHEGVLRGFKSRVLNHVDSSGTLIELEKPKDVVEAEERSEPRCSCFFPAIVVEGERAAQAVVEDMSSTCSRVRFLNGGLPESDASESMRLTFHPFDMSEGYSVGCSVRSTFMKDGQKYAILEFSDEELDARKRIADFIEAQVCCGIPRL